MLFKKMMEKELEINDILNAVNSISKIEKKKTKIVERKDSANKDDVLLLTIKKNQIKAKSLFLIK